MSKQFYMLFVEGGESPRHQHDTLKSAKKEAERLATLTGKPVHVLRSTIKIEDITDTKTKDEKSFEAKVKEYANKHGVHEFVAACEVMKSERPIPNPLFPFGGIDFGFANDGKTLPHERFSPKEHVLTFEIDPDTMRRRVKDLFKDNATECKKLSTGVRDLEQENQKMKRQLKEIEAELIVNFGVGRCAACYPFITKEMESDLLKNNIRKSWEHLHDKIKGLERQIETLNRKPKTTEKVFKFDTTELEKSTQRLKETLSNFGRDMRNSEIERLKNELKTFKKLHEQNCFNLNNTMGEIEKMKSRHKNDVELLQKDLKAAHKLKPVMLEKDAEHLAKIKSFFDQYGGAPGPKYSKWLGNIINKYCLS